MHPKMNICRIIATFIRMETIDDGKVISKMNGTVNYCYN